MRIFKRLILNGSSLAFLCLVAFVGARTLNANAVTSSAPSGTFICLSNTNTSGFVTSKTGANVLVNQLLQLTFDPNTLTGTVDGLVTNTVASFEGAAAQTDSVATGGSTTFTMTADSPSANIFKMVTSTPSTYYVGSTNSGNSLYFMKAPGSAHAAMVGTCQKI